MTVSTVLIRLISWPCQNICTEYHTFVQNTYISYRRTLGRAQRNWAADHYAPPVCSNLQFQASLKISYNKLVTYVRTCTLHMYVWPCRSKRKPPTLALKAPQARRKEKKKNSLDRGWIISGEIHVNNLPHDNWGGGVYIYFLLTYSLFKRTFVAQGR